MKKLVGYVEPRNNMYSGHRTQDTGINVVALSYSETTTITTITSGTISEAVGKRNKTVISKWRKGGRGSG